MGLFNKKKEETKSCCCAGNYTPGAMKQAEEAKSAPGIKVLGGGCAKCLWSNDHPRTGGGWESGFLRQGS